MAKVKVANHKYICPECNGNGYNKVYDMIVQCDKCKSEGELRTPKYRQRKVESKKKYNRKREVVGYYMDYDGKERILYKDDRD